MKRRNVLSLLIVVACAFLFTGCGPELVELTAEERQQIVNYAAHVVSEFNLRQEKGYIALSAEVLEALDGEDKEEDTKDEDTEKPDDESSQDKDDNASDDKEDNTSDEKDDATEKNSTLTDALGIEGIEAKVKSYSVVQNYAESSFVNVNPGEDNRLVVVTCVLTNDTEESIICNISDKELTFYIQITADKRVESMMTILSTDLTTMNEELQAGEEKEMVIIFQIPAKEADSLDSIKLIVKNESTNHTISMN